MRKTHAVKTEVLRVPTIWIPIFIVLLLNGAAQYTWAQYPQSPGGIAHHSVWLQGNFSADTTLSGTLNFNPATALSGPRTQIKTLTNISDLRRATIFTVYQKSALDLDTSVWKMTGPFGDVLFSTHQVSGDGGKMNLVFEKSKTGTSNPKRPVATISTYVRRIAANSASKNEDKSAAIQFGNPAFLHAAGQPSGLVAEFIVYETILKEKEMARIETYLALKYGITLEKNYLNSRGETIWDRKAERLFSNNIAGIARDDHSTLYQKQGTSCSTSDRLTIGAFKIAPSNSKNPATIKDGDYLIWGDNAQTFTLGEKDSTAQRPYLLSDKKWLMKRSGTTANAIETSLQIDTKTLLPAFFPKENLCLAIDRSASGDFLAHNCTYILPDSISATGIASFSKIVWDTDGSGSDMFSFGVKPTLSASVPANDPAAAKLVSFHVYPNPLTEGHYTIAAKLDKRADLIIQVYDLRLHLIDSRKVTGQADYLLSGVINAAAGSYIVKLITPTKEFSQIIIKQ